MLTEWFRSDVELRAQLVAMSSMQELLPALRRQERSGRSAPLRRQDHRRSAPAGSADLPSRRQHVLFKTERVPAPVDCESYARTSLTGTAAFCRRRSGSAQVSVFDQSPPGLTPYRVAIVHDLSFVDRRQNTARDYLIAFAAIAVLIVALFLALAAWLLHAALGQHSAARYQWPAFLRRRAIRAAVDADSLRRCGKVLREMEESQRIEIDYRENWTPQALQQVVREQLHSPQIVVVSNREPYSHEFGEGRTDRGAGACQRHGHGAGTGHARLFRHLGGSRQRRADRESVDQPRSSARAARGSRLYAAPRLAVGRRRAGLLLRSGE
jgi:trehalose 6-phosphate synthase